MNKCPKCGYEPFAEPDYEQALSTKIVEAVSFMVHNNVVTPSISYEAADCLRRYKEISVEEITRELRAFRRSIIAEAKKK